MQPPWPHLQAARPRRGPHRFLAHLTPRDVRRVWKRVEKAAPQCRTPKRLRRKSDAGALPPTAAEVFTPS